MKLLLQLPFLLLLILVSMAPLFSQNNQVRFEHITSEEGLSENVVNCIYQDSKGFMWFGTHDGLNRYDGYNFTVFKPSPDNEHAINSNLIFAITEDLIGNIWVGTTGSGLNCFNPISEKFTYFRHDPDQPESLSNDQVLCLNRDNKGRVWIGTMTGLDLLLPGATMAEIPRIVRLQIAEDNNPIAVNEVVEDKRGNIWVGTRAGLFKCIIQDHNDDFRFQQIHFEETPNPQSIRAIKFDENGKLIIGTTSGLYYQSKEGSEEEFEKISDGINHQSITLDDQGKIWTGTYKGLLCYKAPDRNASLQLEAAFTVETDNPNSLNKNVIKSLFKDKTGIIWIGTNGGGVNKFDPDRKPFFHFGKNLNSNGNRYKEIRSIYEDSNGDLWIGTEGGGLFWQHRDHDDGQFNHFIPIAGAKRPFALEEVTENGRKFIYIGSEDQPSLHKIDISQDRPGIVENIPGIFGSVFTILQDKNGTIWIGTYNQGLNRWTPNDDGSYQKKIFRVEDAISSRQGISNDIIRKVYQDSEGNIWIGTADGLNLIEASQRTQEQPVFHVFKNIKEDKKSLSHNYILDIKESAVGQLWVGTFGGGLNKVNFTGDPQNVQFARYLEQDGLSNNSVKSMEEDIEGNLWLGTNHGLSKFHPEQETFQNYSTNDGLQADEFFEVASVKRANGEMLFGGVNGFNIFYPGNIDEDHNPPNIVFTKFQVNNREVHPGEKVNGREILGQAINNSSSVTLKFSQNDFSIDFAALHYAAPQQNRYIYKLEGYHKDWIEVHADKRYATFTNLRHGNYTLLVKASNGDNIWTPEPTKLAITIKPPLWLTWYAYLFYALLIVASLWLFRQYTVISVHEKHKLMLEHLEREKLEELNQMKLRFFTNISHEFRTPLTLIIAPIEHILEKGKAITSENLQQQYHYMYKNAKYLLRLVNQLLDFRKLDRGSLNLHVGRGNIVKFIHETTGPFQFIASKKNVNYHILNPDSNIYTLFDPDVIEKVMYNLLSNAFKFTPSGGTVSVQVLEREGKANSIVGSFVEIQVKDDGPGVSRKKVKKIFERFYKEGTKIENKDGAGIGLSYTKSLVELHHGDIRVESVKGEGACFIVRLPMDKKAYLKSEIDQTQIEQFEATSDPLEYLVAEPVSELPGTAISIEEEEREEDLPLLLFVDDNADIRRFIKEGFQNDFRIILAQDGEEGYEMATSSFPDLIVSDVMMPNLNGIELCEALKTNPSTSHIPIVLLTAKSKEENELEGLKTGADAYVVKPFKLDILRAQLLNIHLQRERLKQRFRQEVLLEPKDVTVTSADEEFLKRAMSIIEEHMSDSEFNVEALVKEMYISRSKLYLKLKALTGQSSSEFMRTVRLKRAVQLLEKSDYTIKEIMYMTGFNTASYFSKCFKIQFGIVPSEYLRKQKELSL